MPRQDRPSRPVSLALALVAGAAAGGVAAAAYLSAGHHFGAMRGAFVGIAAVTASTVAAAIVLHARRAHGRGFATAVLAVTGTIAYAMAWVLRIAPDAARTLDAPGVAGQLLAFAFASQRPPLELWLLLGAELGIFATVVYAFGKPFRTRVCYWCGSACVLQRDVARRADADPAQARPHIEKRSWRWFDRLGPPATGARQWIRFDLSSCGCGLTRAVSAVRVRRFHLDTTIARDVRVKPEDVRAIRTYDLPEVKWYGYGNDSWDGSESGVTA